MPVQEAATRCFANDDFPAAYHLKLGVPVLNFHELSLTEHICIYQIEAVSDHSLSQLVVATLVAFNNVHHELHHVVLDCRLLLGHGINFLHAPLNLSHDEFTSVSVDQDDPFVDKELLCLKFNLDGFEHFYGLNYYGKRGLRHCHVILLKQQQVHFKRALYLCGELDAVGYLICADL